MNWHCSTLILLVLMKIDFFFLTCVTKSFVIWIYICSALKIGQCNCTVAIGIVGLNIEPLITGSCPSEIQVMLKLLKFHSAVYVFAMESILAATITDTTCAMTFSKTAALTA